MTRSQKLLTGLFCTTGVLHFAIPQVYEDIVPDYLPAQRELVYVSGIAEIAGGLGVIHPRTRRAAGFGLAALLVAVFPANVHMAVNSGDYDQVPAWVLWARLPLQPLAIWWALRATA